MPRSLFAERRDLVAGLLAFALSCAPCAATSYYVATNGSDAASGLDWANALLTISNAVAKAQNDVDDVLVSNGTYETTAQIEITNGITVRSVNGKEVTVVRRSGPANHRIFSCSDPGAVIDGFTIRDGNVVGDFGGGVYMTDGTLRNCLVADSHANTSLKGGGVYLNGGATVSNCVITGSSGYHYGGGLHMAGANVVVRESVVSNNSAYVWGGGAWMANGTMLNCLVVHNRVRVDHSSYNGGGIRLNAGRVVNCTISDNTTLSVTPGAGLYRNGGVVTNCIVYHNEKGGFADDIAGSTAGITHSCSPGLSGSGNTGLDPDLIDRAGGNYHPRIGSACIDAGTNTSLATDLAGAARPLDGNTAGAFVADMGAYEEPPVTSGVFRCSVSASTNAGLGAATVVFTGYVAGDTTSGLYYWWDFEDDGTNDVTGVGRRIVTNNYLDPGSYSVRLTVSNDASEVAFLVRDGLIGISPTNIYVATGGGHQAPYGNWAGAATNLASALAFAADTVRILVSNGTYAATELLVDDAITIESVNGRDVTILQGSGVGRLLRLRDPGATVRGLTLTGGNVTGGSGGAIWLEGATLLDCIVTNNRAASSSQGGAIYMQGSSRVEDCLISGNSGGHYGGGVRMNPSADGLLANCVISSNAATIWGGGIDMTAGTVRNCLIVRNSINGNHSTYGGAGMRTSGGAVVINCTIANNTTLDVTPGGGIRKNGGAITNTIVYYNKQGPNVDNINGSTANVGFSCATELAASNGNTPLPPEFVDHTADDYSLLAGSPCIDTGTNLASVTTDLAGTNRPIDGDGVGAAIHDMGAYEAPEPSGGPLTANFTASTNAGVDTLQVVFTASISGANTNGLYYWWDFEDDGAVDREGGALRVVTNLYSVPGIYDVRMAVSNSANETESVLKTELISVYASHLYVDGNGPHTTPFTNWSTASTSLLAAVTLATHGSVIHVTNGTYAATALLIGSGLTLQSVNGAEATTITNPSLGRLLDVQDTNCVIDGFTLTGGNPPSGPGGAVRMDGGVVRNCIVVGNRTMAGNQGGAIYAGGNALVEDCVIAGNSGMHASGGVWMDSAGALLRNCVITNNDARIWGGGVFGGQGTVRNCLIANNRVSGNHTQYGGGGVRLLSAVLENCTIANNSCPADSHGGGIWMGVAGVLTNCIVYHNTRGVAVNNIEAAGYGNVGYSCCPDLAAGVKGNITAAPLFVNAAVGDYGLDSGSPAANKGTNLTWTASAVDLAGNPRIISGRVDMGAYERRPPPGTLFVVR